MKLGDTRYVPSMVTGRTNDDKGEEVDEGEKGGGDGGRGREGGEEVRPVFIRVL